MTCTLESLRTNRWSCSASSSIHTKLATTKKWRRPAMTVQASCGDTSWESLKRKTKICIWRTLPAVQHICHSTAAADEIRRGWGTGEDELCCWSWDSSYTGGRWRWPKQRKIVQQSHTFGLATLKMDPLVEAEKTGRGQHVLWSTWSYVCNFTVSSPENMLQDLRLTDNLAKLHLSKHAAYTICM